jgi:4'-phosphopantetheinyl transferase
MSHPASTTSSSSRPDQDGVEVWRVSLELSSAAESAAAKLIPPDELAHINSYRRPEIRLRQLLAHAAVRSVLAERSGLEPLALRFSTGPHGKPLLALNEGALHFNLSHSGELALIAVSASVEVGVDVEHIRPIHDVSRLAERFFTAAEASALAALPEADRNTAFFRMWTRKEALLKATGQGIANGLQCFEVSCEPEGGLLAWDGGPEKAAKWMLHTWNPAEDYVATVATPRPDVHLELREFRFGML